jgi:CDP-diacylglycerol--serine O-phosphatidyltransferase
MKHIPNLLTSLNLASGFLAIISVSNGNLLTASWLILCAMIFDFLDGFSARILKAYSEIGKELDSLSDLVSFGVAPALIMYKMLAPALEKYDWNQSASGSLLPVILISTTALMPVCAALRLAIFNLDKTQALTFKGLPTPANAIAVISVVLAVNYSGVSFLRSFTESPSQMIIYTLVLSLLMITRLPLLSNKFSSFRFRGNEGRYVLTGIVVILFVFFGISAAPFIIPVYIIISLFFNYLLPHQYKTL